MACNKSYMAHQRGDGSSSTHHSPANHTDRDCLGVMLEVSEPSSGDSAARHIRDSRTRTTRSAVTRSLLNVMEDEDDKTFLLCHRATVLALRQSGP